jgi:RNA polymerase sigma factor (sigma-70 family)
MGSENLDGVMKNLRVLVAAEGTRELADDELLGRWLRESDEGAFAALVQRHGGMVLGVCRHRLRRLQDAEDACQAVFLILARKAASIRKRESLAGWLHGVAYRVARDHALRLARREGTSADADAVSNDVADEVTLREFQSALDEEFRGLDDHYRAPLLLCYLEGKTRDEAARQLGWSLTTLKGRLERGRAMLRSRLVKRGLITSVALFTAFESGSAAAGTMPVHLLVSTTRVALCYAANPAAAAAMIPAPVAALTKGVLQSMFIAKVKVAVAASLAICVTGLGAGAGIYAVAKGPAETQVAQAPGAPAPSAPVKDPAKPAAPGVPAKNVGIAVPGAPGAVPGAPAAAPGGRAQAGPIQVIAQPAIAFPVRAFGGGVAIPVQDAAVVVVGKVGKFEEKEQLEHRIAVIKIEESFKGMKGLTSVRVGTPAMQNDGPAVPPINVAPGGGFARPAIMRLPAPAVTEGAEGVFFLKKHDKGDFYVLVNAYTSFLPKTQPNYEEQVKLIRDVAKFLETPLEKSLKADKAEDRLLAAGMLIVQYRTRKDYSKPAKEEEIDAEQSKLILKALEEADFNKVEPRLGMTPLDLFYRLGVTQKDGWTPPRPKFAVPPNPAPGAPAPAPGAPLPPVRINPGFQPVAPGAPAPIDNKAPAKKADDKETKAVPPGKADDKETPKAAPPAVAPVPVIKKPVGPPVAVPLPPVQIQIGGGGVGGAAIALPPRMNAEYVESIKAWLKKNQETYRIKRFVEASK